MSDYVTRTAKSVFTNIEPRGSTAQDISFTLALQRDWTFEMPETVHITMENLMVYARHLNVDGVIRGC
jgi:hypothetical protein